MRKQRGVTLIALIVTIIVLIILAGVTISALISDDGIVTEAEVAAEDTELATAKEELVLAWSKLDLEYWRALSKDKNTKKEDYYNEEKLNNLLSGKGTVTDFSTDSNGKSTGKYTPDGTSDSEDKTFDFTIDKDGNATVLAEGTVITLPGNGIIDETIPIPGVPLVVPTEQLASQITSANYGDKVEYSANGVTDWRIFYKDNSGNVFIITSDYLENSKISVTATGMTVNGTYNTYWTSEPANLQETTQLSLFKATKYTLNSSLYNSKCVSSLLNTNNWINFVNTKATYAIGSPTVEMWFDSWNAKYNDTLVYSSNSYGYPVGINSSSLDSYISGEVMRARKGYTEAQANINNGEQYGNIYYPHPNPEAATEAYNGCIGYRLASSGSLAENSMMLIRNNGYVATLSPDYSSNPDNEEISLRPVVCLKSGILGAKSGDTWILGE